jgi:hypothetical protein
MAGVGKLNEKLFSPEVSLGIVCKYFISEDPPQSPIRVVIGILFAEVWVEMAKEAKMPTNHQIVYDFHGWIEYSDRLTRIAWKQSY